MANHEQLQQLYNHLDCVSAGDRYMSYYGQCRADDMGHVEAIKATIEKFGIAETEWYKSRLANDQRGRMKL